LLNIEQKPLLLVLAVALGMELEVDFIFDFLEGLLALDVHQLLELLLEFL